MFVYKDQAEIPKTERETHENTCKSFLRLFVDFVVVVDTRDRLGSLASEVCSVKCRTNRCLRIWRILYQGTHTNTHTAHTKNA